MDPELEAMQSMVSALTPLDPGARQRVISWAAGRFELTLATKTTERRVIAFADADEGGPEAPALDPPGGASTYETLAEAFSAASPGTNGQKALVVGYWLQAREGMTELDSQRINKELKHLGYGVANITTAMDELKAGKPAYAIQLKKSGSTRQARKKYKITDAGVKAVGAVLRGESWP